MRRRSDNKEPAGFGTRAVWAGENGKYWEGATQIPVALSVSFGYEDVNHWLDVAQGKTHGHIYGRNTNPTVAAFEEKVRNLETAKPPPAFPAAWVRSATRYLQCCLQAIASFPLRIPTGERTSCLLNSSHRESAPG